MAEEKKTRQCAREWLLIGVLTAVALALRLIGIRWGLPNEQHYFSYHPDEIFLLLPAFRFAQGVWNPGFFNYGPLYPFLVGIPAVSLGFVPSAPFPQGLAPLYLWGRHVTAVMGAATIPLLYTAIRREHRGRAWGAAFLLTICPLHVVNSHYATVDVPATFFLVVAFAFALRGADDLKLRSALLTGAAIGVAAATKYNLALFILPALLVPVLASRTRPSLAWWGGVPAGLVIGFLVCNPFVGTPEFRQGFLFELRHAQQGGTLAFVNTGSGWAYHLLRGLPTALGYPLLALITVGTVLSLRSKSVAVRLSLVWVVWYLFAIGFGKERFIRYLVPLMPFVCVLGCQVLACYAEQIRPSRFARLLRVEAPKVLIFLTLVYLATQMLPLCGIDGRDWTWIQTQSDILESQHVQTIGLVDLPWYFHPPMSPYNAGAFSKESFENWNTRAPHRVVITGWEAARFEVTTPDIFILSDLESADFLRLGNHSARALVERLSRSYSDHRTFESLPSATSRWLAPPRQLQPPDWRYPSPIITVYSRPRDDSG